eukprot:CAMPEP_0175988354 /NCGR_PEP_ID=MMETSP0108-20121206/51207_1 /TAXON_ID=195067 ORGANISM="Goniomonas pacifica, Strain CCMP1869" /NCGR_SAMPLE_ID=MMETSP0108 /ASSEMBLY_ACC=CAM_ASM_000204 /LENGTH=134 /DNA_ID=CAMNT_0017319711 /DNA_START=196 /DNA_END=598 /DNA_ORIENTATION=+
MTAGLFQAMEESGHESKSQSRRLHATVTHDLAAQVENVANGAERRRVESFQSGASIVSHLLLGTESRGGEVEVVGYQRSIESEKELHETLTETQRGEERKGAACVETFANLLDLGKVPWLHEKTTVSAHSRNFT